jgi:hypothetical protein
VPLAHHDVVVMRETYVRKAERLAGEINRALIDGGAGTFCLLRNNSGGAGKAATAYWLSFTRMTDGAGVAATEVFADNPKDASVWLSGYLAAVTGGKPKVREIGRCETHRGPHGIGDGCVRPVRD